MESLSKKQKESALQKAYRAFFKRKLGTEYKVDSPSKLSPADKSKFFDSIKTEWPREKRKIEHEMRAAENADVVADDTLVSESKGKKAKEKEAKGKEKSEPKSKKGGSPKQVEYRKFFKETLAKYKVKSPFKLDQETKAKFFTEVKEGWAKQKGSIKAEPATASDEEYDFESQSDTFDADHFLANSEDPQYDHLVEAFDSDDGLNGDYEAEASAASEAKKLGLTHAGFGKWKNKAGKIVKQTVHGKLLGIRAGTKVKKTIAAMKDAHKMGKKHSKLADKHAELAKRAHEKGDTKGAKAHEKLSARHAKHKAKHGANYEKLKTSIGEHGDIAHSKYIKHSGKQFSKKLKQKSMSAETSLSLSDCQEAYRAFFRKKLEEYGVNSPSQLSDVDKSEFFSSIKAEWLKAKRAAMASESSTVEAWESMSAAAKLSHLQKAYRKFFKAKLKEHKVKSPAHLDKEGKTKFFNRVKTEWPKHKKLSIKDAKEKGIAVPKQKAKAKKA